MRIVCGVCVNVFVCMSILCERVYVRMCMCEHVCVRESSV